MRASLPVHAQGHAGAAGDRSAARAPDGLAERVHASGMRVGTWISDDPDEAVELMRAGVDAVATNDPGRILAARRRAFGA